jgi:diguanylate cyclase (GGDEF)-like protein
VSSDPGFVDGGIDAFRVERNLALIFTLLAIVLSGVMTGYWLLVLEPSLRDEAESRARALAQAQARGIEWLFGRDLPPGQLVDALETRLDAIILLKEDQDGQALTHHVRLELDPETARVPMRARSIERGQQACSHCITTEVPLYHPRDYSLVGVASFVANTGSLEMLLTNVRSTFLWTGCAILLLIATAWIGVSWLLRRLRESESNLSSLLDVAPFPILLLEREARRIRRANRAARRYLRLEADPMGRLTSNAWETLLGKGIPTAEQGQSEVQFDRDDGSPLWALVSATQVNFSNEAHPLISLVDVSELKRIQHRLHQAANTDGLTKSYNRRYLFARLTEEVARADREGGVLSVVLFDLDHFKAINDGFGHSVGDQVLTGIAEITRRCIRDADVCGRYGGEEFLVILPSASSAVALEIAERVRSTVANEQWPHSGLVVSISGGVAEYNGTGLTQLLETADKRLYRAKQLGRNRIVV